MFIVVKREIYNAEVGSKAVTAIYIGVYEHIVRIRVRRVYIHIYIYTPLVYIIA